MSNDNVQGPGSETYTLLNGLNIDEDEVLGTYRAWITNGQPGTPWIMTARLAGELEWAISGVIPEDYASYDDRTFYPVTVTEHTESTCDIDLYGRKINTMSIVRKKPTIQCPTGKIKFCHSTFWGIKPFTPPPPFSLPPFGVV